MKKMKFFLAGILLSLTCLAGCDSCKDDEITELPSETQTGANTFGCYVNGELFVAQKKYGPFGAPYLSATYSDSDGLGIDAYASIGIIGIGDVHNCVVGLKQPINVSFRRRGSGGLYQEEDGNVGEILITKFDTIHKIVSGTFSATIKLYYWTGEKPSDDIVYITQGRFDLPLELY